MDADLMKALLTVFNYCTSQDDCRECAFKDFCQKIPAEWI